MTRLNTENLEKLPAEVARPQYDRSAVKPGIVHLGLGAFHRVHQAVYTDQVLAELGGDWGIIGADTMSDAVKNQIVPQDGLYSVMVKDNDEYKVQVIGSVLDVKVGPENPQALIDLMADESIKIVSLTVTEKGYCHDPASGQLNVDHPFIQADIKTPDQPKSVPGYLVAAMKKRRDNGVPVCTLLSCDNLPNNGHVLKNVVLTYASLVDKELAEWIESNITFPCTMVDRIAPAVVPEDLESLEGIIGMRDEGGVVCEPFRQWVIEDNFCSDRPAWEKVGALLVDDVEIFEHMKLRLLNGSHSVLAYCGYLSGFPTISSVMQEPAFVKLCEVYMDREAGQTVDVPDGFDIDAYKKQLRDRYINRGLQHKTWQIAMDGSQKIPQRWLGTLRDQLKAEGNIDILCLGVAAWIRYVSAVDEKGEAIDVRDPLAEKLKAICDTNKGNYADLAKAIIGMNEVFDEDLINVSVFVDGVTQYLEKIYDKGVLAVIQENFA